ncbi:MAG TPA: ZIP family metal transporter [Candidatus Limnocylindria bacterium]
MLEAGLWGLAAASTLIAGTLIGLFVKIPRSIVALVLAFGVGALISAVAFDLAEEAFRVGGTPIVAIGLGVGALTYYGGDQLLSRRGGTRRGARVEQVSNNGLAIVLGALLDGIPESIVLGSTLLGGGTVSIPFFFAVAISNVPEALTASVDLRREGHRSGWIIRLWVAVAVISGLAAAIGFGVLGEMGSSVWVPLIQAFAAGAILTMLVDTMIPEAFADGGNLVGLATVLGFATAFFLNRVT